MSSRRCLTIADVKLPSDGRAGFLSMNVSAQTAAGLALAGSQRVPDAALTALVDAAIAAITAPAAQNAALREFTSRTCFGCRRRSILGLQGLGYDRIPHDSLPQL